MVGAGTALERCRDASLALASGTAALRRERDAAILAARHEGHTLAEVGKAAGISGVAVSKILARHDAPS